MLLSGACFWSLSDFDSAKGRSKNHPRLGRNGFHAGGDERSLVPVRRDCKNRPSSACPAQLGTEGPCGRGLLQQTLYVRVAQPQRAKPIHRRHGEDTECLGDARASR